MSRSASLSRRSLLSASAAGIAAGGHAYGVQAASEPDPAEVAFLRWLSIVSEINGRLLEASNAAWATVGGDEDTYWAPFDAAAEAIVAAPPSVSKAAALLLHELAYVVSELEEETSVAMLDAGTMEDRILFRVLASLVPTLSGRLGTIGADLLAEPHRPLGASLLRRAYMGEVRL